MKKTTSLLGIARHGRDADVVFWVATALTLTFAAGCGSDGNESCQAPKVLRYQQPGCGAEAHPVCGSREQDAGLGFACGCDGEILEGFDYFTKPFSTRGVCPDACNSPTHITPAPGMAAPLIKGCACNPATDAPQCVSAYGGMHLFTCNGGSWKLDMSTTCTPADGGTPTPDGGVQPDAPTTPDGSRLVDGPAALDGPDIAIDGTVDGTSSDDGGTCRAPNVWRYQQPGCGSDAHPVCGSAMQDAGLAFACGCSGEILTGFDYFTKPFSARGICPDACNSPTHIVEAEGGAPIPVIRGCACDPATDGTLCVPAFGAMHPITCIAGEWKLDRVNGCTILDGGTSSLDGAPNG